MFRSFLFLAFLVPSLVLAADAKSKSITSGITGAITGLLWLLGLVAVVIMAFIFGYVYLKQKGSMRGYSFFGPLLLVGLGVLAVFGFGDALAQGGSNPGEAIGNAIDSATTGLLPKFVAFLGVLASVAIGWAIVKVIKG